MNAKKIFLAIAAVTAMAVAMPGVASAQPWHHDRGARVEHRVVTYGPAYRPAPPRAYVSRAHINRTLRNHRFIGIGSPYFLRGHYVVRSHDRFGRTVLVRLDPWTGRFLGTMRL